MTLFLCIEITSEFDAFLDKIQVVLDVVGVIPVFGDVADALNAVISLCRGNYLEALICLVAILPMGDLLKGLKFADKAKDILKLGDKALTATKTVAKEGAEKLSKQMTKLVKSGKIDNVIATMDAGKDFVVKFKNGSTALIKKGDLSEFVCQAFNKGCFMAGTLVTTKEGLKPIEEVKIGEYVLSRNEESGETSYKKVTDTLIRSTYNICTIELENGKIKSTTGHLFMVKDKWWKAAAELKAGDILETADEQCQRVKSITVEEKGYPVTTYNLSVEDNHTFFVGKLGVLTHNMKGFTPCELADEVAEKATKGVAEANRLEKSSSGLPYWLKERFEAGNNFNKENRPRYPYNEVEVYGKKKYVVDSYVPAEEIVSRKYTQLADVKESTGIGYLNELKIKYPSGAIITDSPFNSKVLRGQPMRGQQILEIPVQNKSIPQRIIDYANENNIIIRDVEGKVYN